MGYLLYQMKSVPSKSKQIGTISLTTTAIYTTKATKVGNKQVNLFAGQV
jgi:hypothetical protein